MWQCNFETEKIMNSEENLNEDKRGGSALNEQVDIITYHVCVERRENQIKYDFIYKSKYPISNGNHLDDIRRIADETYGSGDTGLKWVITSLTRIYG